MNTTKPTSAGCACLNWCREGSKYWTDHHIRCEHHIPGTIVVCKVSANESHYYEHNFFHAVEMEKEGCKVESVVVKAEDYEALPEFQGF
jgi:hypothetical protein